MLLAKSSEQSMNERVYLTFLYFLGLSADPMIQKAFARRRKGAAVMFCSIIEISDREKGEISPDAPVQSSRTKTLFISKAENPR